jgi:hypothetical protein
MKSRAMLATTVAFLCASSFQHASADNLSYEWYTVANNGDLMPTDTSRDCGSCHEDMASSGSLVSTGTKVFNSYNQPAINKEGVVVFRARSRGGEGDGPGQGEPERGIYMRNLAEQGALYMAFRRHGTVPQPNNTTTGQNEDPAWFNEFPSVPRIDAGSDTIATRGQSTPVWMGLVQDTSGNFVETRTGTAGVYASSSHGLPTTAASMVGDVYGYDASGALAQTFPYFQVPPHGNGAVPSGIGFDQFPGSPAVTERNTIVFKGNFTIGDAGKTGVFYRDIVGGSGTAPIELIASSFTKIPGCKPDLKAVPQRTCLFGSTAPPSAGGKYAVFAGYDNEQAPTLGGIYRARIGVKPIVLQTVVKIGDQVPGERKGTKFEVFGEAVSVSSTGRTIFFWGGWGGKHEVEMHCPGEGNEAMRAACDEATFERSEASTPEDDAKITTKPVPNKQGFFVRDMQLGTVTRIVKTGDHVDGVPVTDFVYWNFSGRVVGTSDEGGDDIEEPARWRSTSFGAVSGNGVPNISAFKARTADGEDGIYLRRLVPSGLEDMVKLLKTGDLQVVDVSPQAAGMEISAVGIERDGFRGNWLALTASMLLPVEAAAATGEVSDETTGWAGVYAAHFLDDDLIAY